jgi:hypothetical protein
MKDPSLNKIKSQFGADVETVAEIGPPREPKMQSENEADGVAEKLAATSI